MPKTGHFVRHECCRLQNKRKENCWRYFWLPFKSRILFFQWGKTLTTFLANHSATYLAELSCRRAVRISSENFFPLAGKCQRWIDETRWELIFTLGQQNGTAFKNNAIQEFKNTLIFKNGPIPIIFFGYFWSFQTNIITIFTTDNVKKFNIHPVYGARIRTHNLQNVSLLP